MTIFQAILIAALLGAAFSAALSRASRVDRKLSALQARLDRICEKLGMPDERLQAVTPAIRAAMAQGKKIEAIRLYRKATGKGLKEAKDDIESLMP